MIEEKIEARQRFDPKVWKKLLPFLKPFLWRFVLVCAVTILVALIDIAIPLFQRYAVNNFIVPRSTEGLGPYAVLYLLMIALQAFLVVTLSRGCISIEMFLSRDLKRAAFVHLQKLPLSYYNKTPVGYILARVMSDTTKIATLVGWSLLDIFWCGVFVLGVLVAMLILNARLALLVIAVVPIAAILTGVFQGRILTVNRRVRSVNSRMVGAYNEGISGAKTSKTLVIEDLNCREFENITEDLYRNTLRATRLNAFFVPLVTFFSSLAAALVLRRGGYLVMGGALDFGMLSAFVSYALGILEPIQQMAGIIAEVIATQVNIERVTNLLEQKCEIEDKPEVVEKYGDCFNPKRENWEPIRGEIVFRDVSFKYPDGDEYVLEHFNLKIPAGTNVAIVGETGAGKSTLVNLACRFFEPTEGRILIDGVDYRERSQLWLHSHIGYVLQTPHLFSGTIRDNIRYGKLDATDEEIEAAARLVSADSVINRLEKGYDTYVGEGGILLSTGEKQLISFARAVIADPPIFVLDEATSSIDTETERLIQQAISHTLVGRTSFIIAHRLSTIKHADLILVVRDGKIIERGTHEELLGMKGYYYSLYTNAQLGKARPGESGA